MYTRKYSPVISPPPDYSGTSFLPPVPLTAPKQPKKEPPEPLFPRYPLEVKETYAPTAPPTPGGFLSSSIADIPEDDLLLIGLFLLILYGKKDGIRENGDALCLLAFLYFYGHESGNSCRNQPE